EVVSSHVHWSIAIAGAESRVSRPLQRWPRRVGEAYRGARARRSGAVAGRPASSRQPSGARPAAAAEVPLAGATLGAAAGLGRPRGTAGAAGAAPLGRGGDGGSC